MDRQIDQALDAAERALSAGRSPSGTGFWRAVSACRSDRALAERYAGRIAAIDRRAFEMGVRLRVPTPVGIVALAAAAAVGLVAVVLAVRAGAPDPSTRLGRDGLYGLPGFVPAALLLGTAALTVGTHSLAHWVVGRALGIGFTHVFIGGPPPPRPGLKTDYSTYLRASPRARAAMHASGAIVTKVVPFALLSASLRLYDDRPWLTWILVLVGVVQIITDLTLSTKSSDWMKVKRELAAARA